MIDEAELLNRMKEVEWDDVNMKPMDQINEPPVSSSRKCNIF